MFSPRETVRITETIDTLVMVPHDPRDVGIVLDLREDPLADDGVLLHLPPLIQRQRSSLFEKAWGQADLADVMHQPAEMNELLLLFAKAHSLRDIAGIDGDGGRVTRCVSISGIERRHES